MGLDEGGSLGQHQALLRDKITNGVSDKKEGHRTSVMGWITVIDFSLLENFATFCSVYWKEYGGILQCTIARAVIEAPLNAAKACVGL